jgi:hypothetical protein
VTDRVAHSNLVGLLIARRCYTARSVATLWKLNVHRGVMAVTELNNMKAPRVSTCLDAARLTSLGILTDSSLRLPRSH